MLAIYVFYPWNFVRSKLQHQKYEWTHSTTLRIRRETVVGSVLYNNKAPPVLQVLVPLFLWCAQLAFLALSLVASEGLEDEWDASSVNQLHLFGVEGCLDSVGGLMSYLWWSSSLFLVFCREYRDVWCLLLLSKDMTIPVSIDFELCKGTPFLRHQSANWSSWRMRISAESGVSLLPCPEA